MHFSSMSVQTGPLLLLKTTVKRNRLNSITICIFFLGFQHILFINLTHTFIQLCPWMDIIVGTVDGYRRYCRSVKLPMLFLWQGSQCPKQCLVQNIISYPYSVSSQMFLYVSDLIYACFSFLILSTWSTTWYTQPLYSALKETSDLGVSSTREFISKICPNLMILGG